VEWIEGIGRVFAINTGDMRFNSHSSHTKDLKNGYLYLLSLILIENELVGTGCLVVEE